MCTPPLLACWSHPAALPHTAWWEEILQVKALQGRLRGRSARPSPIAIWTAIVVSAASDITPYAVNLLGVRVAAQCGHTQGLQALAREAAT